jgi:OOP family OmpA-OmpF porin
MFRYGGEMLYHFFPDKALVPYVAAGFAGLAINGDASGSKNQGVFDYGVGAKYFITDSFALRADVRHLITTGSQMYNNVSYTVGAHIPFGGLSKAVKPVETPPPAAAVAPPPAAQPSVAPPSPAKAVAAEPKKQASPAYTATVQRICNKPAILNIHFDFDKADIKSQYHSELKIDGDFLKEFPESTGEISGHTDSIGSEEYNQKLSERRANNVKKYLVENFGVNASRISAKGYGESNPIDSNKTTEGRAKNRRIEAIFDCK